MLRMISFNKLFWKIFFAFWITLILIVVLTAFITDHIVRLGPDSPIASFVLGDAAHKRWRDRRRPPPPKEMRMPMPEDSAERPFRPFKGVRPFFKKPHHRGPPPGLKWLSVIVSLVVTGLMSYFLSAYLVRPIQRVRAATNKLSSGDLSVRVAPTAGERKDELGGLSKDFDKMAARIETMVSSQKRMLRDVSHELRTPLARLQVALELARAKSQNAAKEEFDRIEYESQCLNHLIGQILELVRLEQREWVLTKTSVNIRELIEHIVEDADFEASKQGKKVVLASAIDCTVDINEELIGSSIENIVRNAVTYTAEDTTVEVTLEKISDDGDKIKISVLDHGVGVPNEALPHLFEPFFKVRSKQAKGQTSYGIGLAIAERAVRLHNGDVIAKNNKPNGLVVTIVIPLG